jgi:hypothetical protein
MKYTAFSGFEHVASGDLAELAETIRTVPGALVFDEETGHVVDLDPRSPEPQPETRKPGRPKLGVVAREVTLLPRHWEWLARQPGGASVALRKLVEAARSDPESAKSTALTAARDAAYRFATTMAGNAPGYEEAMRALFAGQSEDFCARIEAWPADVRRQLEKMAAPAFRAEPV